METTNLSGTGHITSSFQQENKDKSNFGLGQNGDKSDPFVSFQQKNKESQLKDQGGTSDLQIMVND